MKQRPPKFYGYLYFAFGVILTLFAIQAMNQSEGWDFWTILLMSFAALDFFIAFKHFNLQKRLKKEEQ